MGPPLPFEVPVPFPIISAMTSRNGVPFATALWNPRYVILR